ncbi:MAG: maleylpyruvate isomerase family mycothiol-dependent enzyme [Acidimicrobiales bacterium]|nr:maleylpyruvate isomerase family mycothiol-dependent enzyme [Acidimicrobiales bacterium]MCB9395518.1 maleylpyruvate isomerase family mycothiol-dependent enzyme [Acidimicrobiaceae bacterium]
MAASADPTVPSADERRARFERVADDFDRLVQLVPDERWDAASPCEGWRAVDVLTHVVDTECDLLGRMGFEQPDVEGLTPVAAWQRTRAAMSAAMADPIRNDHAYDGYFGPTTFGRTVDDFYSFDLVVHRWDIARATGLRDHEAIAADLIDWLRTGADGFGDALRMPGICGPEVTLAEGASPQDRLLAWLGRDPSSPAG